MAIFAKPTKWILEIFRTHEPDYTNLPHKEYDWLKTTVYSEAKEEVPNDIPEPKGRHVTTTTTTYVDANLHHDQVTGRAVTACLHLVVNATLTHWYTKRQGTVGTAKLLDLILCGH